jgi:mycoredoxin
MPESSTTIDKTGVTVYWRPGCPYCSRLRRGLRQVGLPVTEVNIWEDPEAASVVRAAAHGNETVPTVVIGRTALVNPSVRAVVDASKRLGFEGAGGPAMVARAARVRTWKLVKWMLIATIIVAGLTADGLGRSGLSWGLDAVALSIWGAFRLVGRQDWAMPVVPARGRAPDTVE